MRGDRLALAVRVRRQVNFVCRGGQLLQFPDDLLFAGNDDVFRVEIVININPQSALGQIFHVAKRRLDRVTLSQILLDGFCLGRRFDND